MHVQIWHNHISGLVLVLNPTQQASQVTYIKQFVVLVNKCLQILLCHFYHSSPVTHQTTHICAQDLSAECWDVCHANSWCPQASTTTMCQHHTSAETLRHQKSPSFLFLSQPSLSSHTDVHTTARTCIHNSSTTFVCHKWFFEADYLKWRMSNMSGPCGPWSISITPREPFFTQQ